MWESIPGRGRWRQADSGDTAQGWLRQRETEGSDVRHAWGPQRTRAPKELTAQQEDTGHDPTYLQKDSSEEKGVGTWRERGHTLRKRGHI